MEFENILLLKEEAIATIRINRPDVRNALNGTTIKEIMYAMEQLEADSEIKVIIFTGSGEKAFAAGADINQLTKRQPLDAFSKGSMSEVYRCIENSKKATIAAINGYALGGGLELALACDIRIASNNAKLGLPELNLAVIPGAGGTQRLARVVGRGKALDMILTGEFILADEAKEIGLVSQVVFQEELMETAKEKARRISQKGPIAIQMAKIAVNKGYDVDMDTALLIENLAQALLYGTDDKVEGTQAFLEKRNATFAGN
ncbi:enoyl-CoA hydratase/isomerase family protein [Oceanobacillus piezotolerans]|uniref:Enoyl-CoA hydratase/isomerase family protein n=1 Tax=Oceanobacillus piezotolerans TaxID=2448030 RepID=A0A498D8Z8_9BACI|nr:enoyl-CoA hydratase-related protein [Oceanobacillus piezotolerans]RLL46883.1 enoyl-CoA hydratase/isomerase family protein [Oceanobacillus piezotolerans]